MNEEAIYLYFVVGILVIASAWIPLFLGSIPLSLPMLSVGAGMALALVLSGWLPFGSNQTELMSRISEFAILIAVLGTGLKLDRRFSFHGWASAWRLLGPVMLVSIAATAVAAYYLLGLSLGLAILIGGSLAPTDPVLASAYAAGPPGTGEEGEAKFALTSEAGLNDGAAFPFVTLGILVANGKLNDFSGLLHWLGIGFVWNVGAGAAIGIALGWLLIKVNSWLAEAYRLSASNSGLVAVGLALVGHAVAQMANANGFVAVFCEAVVMRNLTEGVEYSRTLNHAAAQFERIGMVVVLTMFGVAIVNGVFKTVGWPEIGFAAFVLIVVRPAAVALGFIGSRADLRTRATLGYFGIRGIASLFYAAQTAQQLSVPDGERMHVLVGLVVLASVVLYGATARGASAILGRGRRFHGSPD